MFSNQTWHHLADKDKKNNPLVSFHVPAPVASGGTFKLQPQQYDVVFTPNRCRAVASMQKHKSEQTVEDVS